MNTIWYGGVYNWGLMVPFSICRYIKSFYKMCQFYDYYFVVCTLYNIT